MSLTAMSSIESGRRIFFRNATHNMCRNLESKFLGSGGGNDSNSHQLARVDEKKIFHQLDVHNV